MGSRRCRDHPPVVDVISPLPLKTSVSDVACFNSQKGAFVRLGVCGPMSLKQSMAGSLPSNMLLLNPPGNLSDFFNTHSYFRQLGCYQPGLFAWHS